ncbi:hypothetical protein OG883_45365 [Streptomyces sp. NBC_01142]|uniref:hypothetical protein n=1 Tax=Streptomyces sp. NBC_01142 TaxID=2975865 RepID=UPI00224CA3B3|nr:hypothetical protein [Streptomyces sp. NBC_01142]MCX4826869.1 hypothetical protein [Streptomyces sp. NBC_01142]
MATWKPSYFQAEEIAVRRLTSAHPEEYHRLLQEAKAELPTESCESCAYLGADALELADVLGHDEQGHQVLRALWSEQIRSVDELLRALDGDLGLYYLHGQGLGSGGLERIHDRVRRLEGVRAAPGGEPAPVGAAGDVPTAGVQTCRSRA